MNRLLLAYLTAVSAMGVPTRHPLIPSMPMIGLGSAEAPDPQLMAASVATACQNGAAFVDTAQNYGSEAAIGEGLRSAGATDGTAFLLCKVDLATRAFEDPAVRMRRQVQSTIQNLGVSCVSAAVLHWPICLDGPCDAAEEAAVRRTAWQALEDLVDEGTVGCIGCSNWTPELLDEVLSYARIRPSINEIEFSPVCYQRELLDACTARGVAVVGYSPYGSCWMAKYFARFVPWGLTPLTSDATVRAIAADIGCTPAQVLLRWSLQHGVACIPKSLQPQRVAESVGALDEALVRLSDEQMASLDALNDPRRGTHTSIETHRRIIASPTYAWRAT